MATLSQNQKNPVEHKQNTKQTPLVVVEKIINAPAEKVFHAWTKAPLINEWWGPSQFSCPYADLKFKVGGKYLFAMRDERGGKDMYSTGTFLEIIQDSKIVMTDSPSDKNGNIVSPKAAGMDGPFSELGEAFITVEFEALTPKQTRMVLSHEGLPAKMHDECVEGWSQSLDKLVRLVEARH